MPIVGHSGISKRYNLVSAPPDRFVTLRLLSFGEKILRREALGKATVKSEKGRGRDRRNNDFTAEMQLINQQVTQMEFAKSIVEHNLTFLNSAGQEQAFDFNNPTHYAMLDGNVGEEIQDYITEMNDYESSDEGKF